MTTIHTRQLQQYTHNYNNTHKTTTTIHTRQLQQYTHNYNNTHKTTNNNTHNTPHNTTCTEGKQHHGKKVLYTVPSIFFPHILYSRFHPSSSLLTTLLHVSHKFSFLPPSLHFTSLRFASLHFTSLHFTTLHYTFR